MAAKLFERSKSMKISLDDTAPLTCIVESGEKVQDHVEYNLKVYRGLASDLCWQLQKRYSDFVQLEADLSIAGIELPLPKKKLIGNFDREFVAERQVGLQNYLKELLSKPILYNSLPVKRFLDPDNYNCNFTEVALQHVSMVLRSEKQWDVVEALPEIGWRLRKSYILVKPVGASKVRQILSWCEFGPDRYLPDKELAALMRVLEKVQHPNIPASILSMANESGGIVIRTCYDKGTLRDYICKCKPRGYYLKKYASPGKTQALDLQSIKKFGKQILETLNLLHEKGLPYGHLHAGNVVIEGDTCKLLDLENWLLGLPSYHRQHVLQFKKIQTTELIDVYCFGHLLYEMTFGKELEEDSCDNFPPECPAQLRSVLESILTTEACKNGLPTVEGLLMHPFFSEVVLPNTDKPVLKIPSKLKEALKQCKDEFERRLKEEQKQIYKKKRVSRAKQYHMSEDEKSKRRKSKKKALENGDINKRDSGTQQDEPSAATSKTSDVSSPGVPAAPPPPLPAGNIPAPPPAPGPPPAAPPPPVGAPPPPPVAAAPPPSSAGRGALLNSITGFKKGGLKKIVTVDRSAPKL